MKHDEEDSFRRWFDKWTVRIVWLSLFLLFGAHQFAFVVPQLRRCYDDMFGASEVRAADPRSLIEAKPGKEGGLCNGARALKMRLQDEDSTAQNLAWLSRDWSRRRLNRPVSRTNKKPRPELSWRLLAGDKRDR